MTAARSFAWLLLGSIHCAALLADFLAPYDFAWQQREFPYAPPTQLHLIQGDGLFHLRLAVFTGRRSEESGAHSVELFVQGYEYRLFGVLPCRRHLFGVAHPGVLFLLGTDAFGRDQFSRLLLGSRISLMAGWLGTLLTLTAGALLGITAGFHGGWVDDIIMRVGEACLSLPWLYLLLAGRALLPLSLPPARGYLLLIAVVGVLGWARPARLTRGVVLTARARGYVTAARAFGASNWYLLRVHILPDTFTVLVTQAVLLLPHYIMAEVTLSFFGLGIDEPVPSWGNLLAGVQRYYVLASYWWMLIPALAPAIVSGCCLAIGDALLTKRRSAP